MKISLLAATILLSTTIASYARHGWQDILSIEIGWWAMDGTIVYFRLFAVDGNVGAYHQTGLGEFG